MKTLLVYNSHSGRNRFYKHLEDVIDILKAKGIKDISTYSPAAPRALTSFLKANASRFDLLILSGGDGTLNEAVNGLMQVEKKPKVLYIPSGTINDVGHLLKLNQNYKKMLDLIDDDPVSIDVTQMNDRFFIYVGACGKFTNSSYDTKHFRAKRFFGKIYYYVKGVKEIFKPCKMNMVIETNNQNYSGCYCLMLALNTQRVGGFPIFRKRKVKLNDGKVSVVLFKHSAMPAFIQLFIYFFLGQFFTYKALELSSNRFTITSQDNIQYNTDGETACLSDNLQLIVHQKAIQIYASKKAIKKYF